MSTRAKFKCDTITRRESGSWRKVQGENQWVKHEEHTIEMSPVYHNDDPDHENTKFWEASPSGNFTLGCVNPEAVKMFEPGKEYYIDITPAPAEGS
jgi:hypothetical protein